MIADHKPVTATLKLSVPSHVVAGRKVWRYGQADWERLHDSLADACWDHNADLSTTAAAKWITDTILRSASSCIPLSTLRTNKSSHPWLNDRSIVLDAKRTAEGTPFEKEATLACSAGLAAAYHDNTARTAQKMRCIKPSSKLWWKKAKEVMKHEAQVSSTRASRMTARGFWMHRARPTFSLSLLRKSASFHVCATTHTQCAPNVMSSKRLLSARLLSSVWQCWLASVTIAPLVLTSCLLASSNVARNSWPNLFSPCHNAC